MKKLIIEAVKYIVLGVLATAAFTILMCALLALPELLNYVSGLIGGFMTWVLFISAVVLFLSWCVSERRF